MGKEGVKYVTRPGRIRVGFSYAEIVLADLGRHPNGRTIPQLVKNHDIPDSSVRDLLKRLEDWNRVKHEIQIRGSKEIKVFTRTLYTLRGL